MWWSVILVWTTEVKGYLLVLNMTYYDRNMLIGAESSNESELIWLVYYCLRSGPEGLWPYNLLKGTWSWNWLSVLQLCWEEPPREISTATLVWNLMTEERRGQTAELFRWEWFLSPRKERGRIKNVTGWKCEHELFMVSPLYMDNQLGCEWKWTSP